MLDFFRIARIVERAQVEILKALAAHYTLVTNEGNLEIVQIESHLNIVVSFLSSSPTSFSPTLQDHSEAMEKTRANLAKRRRDLENRSEQKLMSLRNPQDKEKRDFRPKGPRVNALKVVHLDTRTDPKNKKQNK